MEQQPKKIQYLDGVRFRRGIVAGAERVIEHHKHLNAINVFPVPDGDTGSNMAGTMQSIAEASTQSSKTSISDMTHVVAESALMGARGNSGAILAQFMCGFSESVRGLKRIYPTDFINAAELAATRAKEAMSNPKEGTILSVIQDWAEFLKKNTHVYQDFHTLFRDSLGRARQSLTETTEKLAVLRKANVVDAGGQGFVYLLEGVLEFTERGSLAARNVAKTLFSDSILEQPPLEELTFLYCTECLIKGEQLDATRIRRILEPLGDSLITAGSSTLVRVHIHTNTPDVVFEHMALQGEIIQRKVENMLEQHQELFTSKADHPVGIVTDSTCDLPLALLQEYGIAVAPLRLFLDGEELVDKVDLTAEAFNQRLATSASARTSQPAPGDFHKAYTQQLARHEEVLSLHVMALYSGTVQSANAVGRQFDGKVHILDTRTLSAGLGLVVLEAAKRAKSGMSAHEIMAHAIKDTDNVRVFVSMNTLDFAVRGGRMSRGMGLIAHFLNIKPVIEFATRHAGKVDVAAKALGVRHSETRLLALVAREAATMKNLRFAIAHVDAPQTAARYAEALKQQYAVAPEYVVDASAVLGIHSGPGACAVCLLGDR